MNLKPDEISNLIKEQIKNYTKQLDISDYGTVMIAAGIKSHRDTDLICLPEVWYSMPTPKNKEYVGESIDSEVVMRLRACSAARLRKTAVSKPHVQACG